MAEFSRQCSLDTYFVCSFSIPEREYMDHKVNKYIQSKLRRRMVCLYIRFLMLFQIGQENYWTQYNGHGQN